MAKSLRSKIKRRFRTELRQRVGAPHQAKMEAGIQENLKRAIESQSSGKTVLGLKQLMGTTAAPVAVNDPNAMDVEADATGAASQAQTEAQLLNTESARQLKADKKKQQRTRKAANKRKKKFVHFHELRKKGA